MISRGKKKKKKGEGEREREGKRERKKERKKLPDLISQKHLLQGLAESNWSDDASLYFSFSS